MAAIERAAGTVLIRMPLFDGIKERLAKTVKSIVDPPYPTFNGKPLEFREYRREDLKPQTREALDALVLEIKKLQRDSNRK